MIVHLNVGYGRTACGLSADPLVAKQHGYSYTGGFLDPFAVNCAACKEVQK